jgi:tetratricopeptide (TPR) repeat protein
MRRRRLLILAFALVLVLLIWQSPALLKAVPSRYVAAYLPEPLQALAERDHVEMLPTVDLTVDTAALLGQLARPTERSVSTSSFTEPTPTAAVTKLSSGETPATSTPLAGTPQPSPTAQPTPTPTNTPIPFPNAARLGVLDHHFQGWNNCGPATMAMALSYFDVQFSQEQTAVVLKPDPEDRNVSPYEMADYVNNETDQAALSRANGDLDLLRRLVSQGFPVIVELGLDPPGEYRWMGWYGHYLLIVAYDDQSEQVWAYDSWFGTSEVPGENADSEGRQINYDDLDTYWRQFGRSYIVLFDPDDRSTVTEIIGPAMDDETMWRSALARTQEEIAREDDNAFLWFNLGTAYNALGDHEMAAAAFDQARAIGLPWRMLWYQFGPYEAYYEVGRYEDVILLSEVSLQDRPYFEESYY